MKTIIRFKKSELKEYFKSDKLNDPLSGFYLFLIYLTNNEEALLNGKGPYCSKVLINDKIYKKEVYDKILTKYINKQMKHFNDKMKKFELSMYDLNLGPRASYEVPENEIWLLDGWME